jgi:hypothetical protein
MVDLVLHPGHSKCGSTTIQDFIYENRELFKRRGVFLPDLNFNFPCHDEYNFTYTHTPRDYFAQVQNGTVSIDDMSKKLDDLIKSASEMGCRRVIISAENLINGIASKNTKAIHDLFADRFNNIRIVYYVRRQDSLILAAWQQWGHKDGLNLDTYTEKMSKTRFADFNFISEQLKKYYPKAKLKVFPMIREYFIDNNLLVDFCSRALIDKTNLNFKIDVSNTGISSALCDSLSKIQNVYENKHDQNIKNTLINAAPNAAPLLIKKYNNDLSDESKTKLFEKLQASNIKLHKSFFPDLPFKDVMSLECKQNDAESELSLLKRKIEKLEDLTSIQMDMILQLLKKGS